MITELLKLLGKNENLVSAAHKEAIGMLDHGRHMFDMVMDALLKKPESGILHKIRNMDTEINKVQRDVRKKVLEHLVFSRGQDLVDAIVLLTVVVDLERIGDYTKNIGDLVVLMHDSCCLGDNEKLIQKLREKTLGLFDGVRAAYSQEDAKAAQKAIKHNDYIAGQCEKKLKAIFASSKGEEFVPKEWLYTVLVLRFIKRVAGHLKNVATTVINPIDQIGYIYVKERE